MVSSAFILSMYRRRISWRRASISSGVSCRGGIFGDVGLIPLAGTFKLHGITLLGQYLSWVGWRGNRP